jgi:anti-sigma B factor antagonist
VRHPDRTDQDQKSDARKYRLAAAPDPEPWCPSTIIRVDITLENSDNVTIIRLNGSLDGRSVTNCRDSFSKLISEGATRFVVDATQLRFIDSMGLGALIYLRRFARQGGGDVRIAHAGRELREILEISGLGAMFDLVPDTAEALARFGDAPGK